MPSLRHPGYLRSGRWRNQLCGICSTSRSRSSSLSPAGIWPGPVKSS